MKKLLTAIVLTLSISSAFAGEINLYKGHANEYQYDSTMSAGFDTNKKLGRAWVSIIFKPKDSDLLDSELRVKVPGMIFDQTTKEVAIETETGRVVCATEKKGLFGIKSLKETGLCNITEKFVKETVDDGYNTYKVDIRVIKLKY